MAGGGELGADLMGAAGDELTLHQGQAVADLQGLVEGDGSPPAGHRRLVDGDLVLALVLGEEALQLALRRVHAAVDGTQVVLFDLPVLDFLVHDAQGLGGLGGDDDAAGVPVDAVAQGGGEGVFLPGVPLLFLIKVGLDVGDEGVDVLPLVRVDQQAGALVHQEDVLVLIDDVQLGLEDGEEGVLRGGGVEELIVDVELEHIAHRQAGVPLGALSVELHPLEADVFLGQGSGEEGQGLAQPAVQTLPGVVFCHGKLSHWDLPVVVVAYTLSYFRKKVKKVFDIDRTLDYNICRAIMRGVPCD